MPQMGMVQMGIIGAVGIVLLTFLMNVLFSYIKGNRNNTAKVFNCPLDKSNVISKIDSTTQLIDKQESKLNTLISTTEYTKTINEFNNAHLEKIQQSLTEISINTRNQTEEIRKSNKLLSSIKKD